MKRWVYTLLIVIFAGIFLVSAFYIGSYFWESYVQQNKYDDLAHKVQNALNNLTQPTQPNGTEGNAGSTEETGGAAESTPPASSLVQVENPKTGKQVWVLPEYAEIYQMNPDLVGWIRISGTGVDYPVVQRPDEVDYYLYRNFDEEYSKRGCLYVREVCDVALPSDNVTIYGHCMRDGTMFGQLSKYRKKNFFETHSTFTFDTLTEHVTYQIVAVFTTTANVGQGFAYHQFVSAVDEAQFNEFVATCKRLSLYDTGVNATYGDKLICLSTCEYTHSNGRLVIVAKRVA